MYYPSHYKSQDPQLCRALIQAFPMACIVRHTDQGLQADHIPLQSHTAEDGGLVLRGHVARANPLWRQEGPCLAIFQAEQGYISPNWYPSKFDNGKQVPTWNYSVAHVQAQLLAKDDKEWMRNFLAGLTAEHEASQERPWRMDEAPPDYLDKMLGAVVGIELRVSQFELKFKLSQNRDQRDLQGAVDGLKQGAPAQQALAAAMARFLPAA